mmetsp:Transcript_33254/g.81720  ORF Transcript_33254/g.81720 Transcript_33254/m.81720 type:complete len:268 (-) Transcript_33254:306-1109(-)
MRNLIDRISVLIHGVHALSKSFDSISRSSSQRRKRPHSLEFSRVWSSPAEVAPMTSHLTATTSRKNNSEYTKRMIHGVTAVNATCSATPRKPALSSSACHSASSRKVSGTYGSACMTSSAGIPTQQRSRSCVLRRPNGPARGALTSLDPNPSVQDSGPTSTPSPRQVPPVTMARGARLQDRPTVQRSRRISPHSTPNGTTCASRPSTASSPMDTRSGSNMCPWMSTRAPTRAPSRRQNTHASSVDAVRFIHSCSTILTTLRTNHQRR